MNNFKLNINLRKYIAILLFSFFIVNTISTTSYSSNLTDKQLNQMSVNQLLEYCKSIGIDYEVLDYNKIDKAKLVEAIINMRNLPTVINFDNNEDVNKTINTNSDKATTYALDGSIRYGMSCTKSYKGLWYEGAYIYNYKLNIKLTYDMYSDALGTKTFYNLYDRYGNPNITVTDNSDIPLANSYTHLDAWFTNSTNLKDVAKVSGNGRYSYVISYVKLTKTVTFSATFLPGE